ncbi:SRPBCC family protein [Microbacterium arborescens]|jgi:ligand-binding SRPBCC domain-containing protein|nr:SRPBCC family protein [Microbacterium arborescens]WJM17350.1 SRPBCC family protein [Microbacterium arborescens]
MTSSFEIVTRAAVSAEALFDASRDIGAHVASMRGTGERAIDGVTSGLIGLDETVTWRAWHFGIPFRMTSRVTALDRPLRFVDEQVSGPFRVFRHEHLYVERDGMTIMTDRVTLASPVLGRIAERLVLVPYLRRLLTRRAEHLVTSVSG